ncbi:MAG: hypothetical protein M0C28_17745 [Candidatus Moduliflexus flocculans]|nr:hypothetical protein [Candidatus Moduliflexus flocculans]
MILSTWRPPRCRREVTVRREKELELRESLRQVRSAIDAFHDWKSGKIPKDSDAYSEDGYPQDPGDPGRRRRPRPGQGQQAALPPRRIPRDLRRQLRLPAEQWVLRGYQDETGRADLERQGCV